MEEIISHLKEIWAFVATVGAGIAGYFKWKASQDKSTKMLYSELEVLKQKVIIQVSKEVDHATEIAAKNKIINELKEHCPDCYKSYKERKKGNH